MVPNRSKITGIAQRVDDQVKSLDAHNSRPQKLFRIVRLMKTNWQVQVAEDAIRFETEYSTEEALVTLLKGATGAVWARPLTRKQASLSQNSAPFLPLGGARCKLIETHFPLLNEMGEEHLVCWLSKVDRCAPTSAACTNARALTFSNLARTASPVLQHIQPNSPFFHKNSG